MSATARFSRLRDVASDVTRTTIRVARPVVSATAAKVRSRLQRDPQRDPQPSRGTAPSPSPSPRPAVEAAPVPGSRASGPTPATVGRNIAPHPLVASPVPTEASAPPATPGARLPPRRRPADEGRD